MDANTKATIALIFSIPGVATAGIAIYQFIKSFRHGLSAMMHADQYGDELIIFNANNSPKNINYISLDWARPGRFGKRIAFGRKIVESEYNLEGDVADFTIQPNGQYRTVFGEGDSIHWGGHQDDHLCLRLWVTGRKRPIWIWL